eukprot:1264195-Prymnesium_polylepis.1
MPRAHCFWWRTECSGCRYLTDQQFYLQLHGSSGRWDVDLLFKCVCHPKSVASKSGEHLRRELRNGRLRRVSWPLQHT